jgi:hypothetical protein
MATYVVTIGGVTKVLQEGWSIDESANGRNRFDGVVLSRDGSYRPALDDAVVITEDGVRIFGGLIDDPTELPMPGAISKTHLRHRISATDYNIYASRIRYTGTIAAGTYKAFLTVIAAALSAQGVTLDAAQATGSSLPELTYDDVPIEDVLNDGAALASGTGSTSWTWEIDYSKVLRSVESGTLAAPYSLADGDKQVVGDFTVRQPRPAAYANYIIVLGGSGTTDVTDSFTGDGSTVAFALNYQLSSGYGYVTVAGVYETLGTGGTWTYDSTTNTITRTSAPALAAAIVLTYVAQFPKRVYADGGVSAANRVMKTYAAPQLFDKDVLQALANSYLTRDIASPKTITYLAKRGLTGLHPGQTQTIVSTKHGLSGSHLLTNVRIQSVGHRQAQRLVTVVNTGRLPAPIREQFQQTFGRSSGAASATGVTVITGGTYLSSPAFLGGSETTRRACDTAVRVPNAIPYVAPATMSVRVRGVTVAGSAANMTPSLYDETLGTWASGSAVPSTQTPADFSFTTTVTSGHTYWLHVLSGTAGIPGSALGSLEGA